MFGSSGVSSFPPPSSPPPSSSSSSSYSSSLSLPNDGCNAAEVVGGSPDDEYHASHRRVAAARNNRDGAGARCEDWNETAKKADDEHEDDDDDDDDDDKMGASTEEFAAASFDKNEEDAEDEEEEEVEEEEEGESASTLLDRSSSSPPSVLPLSADDLAAQELASSLELARQLMAEEALASYSMSASYLRDNAADFSPEDLAALQAAMMDEDPRAPARRQADGDGDEDGGDDGGDGGDDGGDDDDDGGGSRELSYETMLQLGERIGDVKSERWALVASAEIAKLPTFAFDPVKAVMNDSDAKCLVCQTQYEEGETLMQLPCRHVFHDECVEGWLLRKDCCPYCRSLIVPEKDEKK